MGKKKKFLTDKEIYDLFIEKTNKNALSAITYTNEDELHAKAHALFYNIADEIENEIVIDFSLYGDSEEWYDIFYDDVVQYILEQIVS